MNNLYTYICSKLNTLYDKREAEALARIIIEDILHMSLTKVLAGIERDLTAEQKQNLTQVIVRLMHHEPIQYIIGKTDFCDLPITVNPSVLIPRPETEQLVEIATDVFDAEATVSIMDACTGSGCIAIAIKHLRPCWDVHACDISAEALKIAHFNAEYNDTEVTFSQFDLLAGNYPPTRYNMITSNPPYVMGKEKASMDPNVLEHEPQLALFVDDNNPLVFYDALATWGKQALHTDGYLLVEINHLLSKETAALLESHNYTEVTTIYDSFDKPRFIICKK